ncbi:MAG: carboxypeptidase regulatory-like domain-containing protein [Bryobacterales bacterium]|nr:TonB-dependent receptor [Bryobacteraceae bacterium]MDW8130370.1 carboxypeptidase regulatory-like domain-containing protein [Bryobacterales bacterium]
MTALAWLASASWAILSGLVLDPSGAPVPGAKVTLEPGSRHTVTDLGGGFRFQALPAGSYQLEIHHQHFRPERLRLQLRQGDSRSLRIRLRLGELRQQLQVQAQADPVSTAPAENPDAERIGVRLLRSLPVLDLDVLGAASPLLDPAQAGSGGYRLVVDGMETDRLGVTASAIREVRVNQNPYSAEFSAPGRGRLEVTTARPESRYRGELNLLARDHRLDARNAFAAERPRQQRRTLEGHLTGPVGRSRRWSFLASGSREADDQESVVYALLPSGLLRQQVPRPERDTEFDFRLAFQPDARRWYSLRYEFENDHVRGDDVGGFDLPEVGTESRDREHALHLSLQQTHGPRWLHQWQGRLRRELEQLRSLKPGAVRIVVEDAFTGGGAQREQRLARWRGELLDLWSRASRQHWLKLGYSLAEADRVHFSEAGNREGTYRFSSLEEYLAGRPYAFSRQVGEGKVRFGSYRMAAFLQDDVRLRPNLSAGFGLRYELLRWPRDRNNLAPRLSFAWAPGRRPKTVLRAGAGIFFDRLEGGVVRDALLFDGVRLRNLLLLDPGFPDPWAGGARPVGETPSVVRLADGLRAPYLIHASAGWSRQIRAGTSLSLVFTALRGVKQFRALDGNAPLPPDFRRPDPALATVRVIESAGRMSGRSLEAGLRGPIARFFEGAVSYAWSRTWNDSSGAGVLPANSLDLAGEWARADFDRRHRFSATGRIPVCPWFELGLILRLESGAPYSVSTGRDDNRDGLARDRPPGVPRNSMQGPGLAVLDLRWRREFKLREDVAMALTVDAFNALNRVNFNQPVGNLSSPFFGQPVGARPARRMQLGLQLEF